MQAEQATAVIEVQGLCAAHQGKAVLHDIDLRVHEGEIVAIIGGSGAGKSTLLRCLLGLQRPSAGSIRLLGQELTRLGGRAWHALRREIGVSLQGGALFNSMSVGDNIALPLREHTDLEEETIQIMVRLKLAMVNMAGCEDLWPWQLSGGMVKRVALARAIVMDPKLLFFDEPSSGLDPVVSAELDELILRLRAALPMTILVITHEIPSAFSIADRVAVLDRGHLIATGTPEELRAHADPRVRCLIERKPLERAMEPETYLQQLTQNA